MIRQLDPLLSFPATDLPRAVHFYTAILGAIPVVEVPDEGFYIFRLPEGDGLIGLHRHEGPLGRPDPGGIWCWFRVADLEEAIDRVRAAGATILDEPSELGPGRHQAFLDPEGNVLRFYEPIDRVERSIDIHAPIARVFSAITTAETIERWFASIDNVAFEAKGGGAVSFLDPVFGPVEGAITAWDPPTGLTIAFTRNWPSQLEYRLHEAGDVTTLTVVQHGFAPIRDRDFGIPGLIEQVDAALARLSQGDFA
jgi:predicted enzyme related to lactoylglutathione lyase/uncharacterized protein YndB with AHSA1/START domain